MRGLSNDASVIDVIPAEKVKRVTDVHGVDEEMRFKNVANPDYKFVMINASNEGFMTQMGTKYVHS